MMTKTKKKEGLSMHSTLPIMQESTICNQGYVLCEGARSAGRPIKFRIDHILSHLPAIWSQGMANPTTPVERKQNKTKTIKCQMLTTSPLQSIEVGAKGGRSARVSIQDLGVANPPDAKRAGTFLFQTKWKIFLS
jgi:hypothetical protein